MALAPERERAACHSLGPSCGDQSPPGAFLLELTQVTAATAPRSATWQGKQ